MDATTEATRKRKLLEELVMRIDPEIIRRRKAPKHSEIRIRTDKEDAEFYRQQEADREMLRERWSSSSGSEGPLVKGRANKSEASSTK